MEDPHILRRLDFANRIAIKEKAESLWMYVQESETYMADDNVTLCICYLTEGKTSRPTIIKGDSPMNIMVTAD